MARRGVAAGWLTIPLGLAAALALLLAGQELAGRLPASSLTGQIVVFYLALFAPLLALGVVLGAMERRPALRWGHAPLRWSAVGLFAGAGGLGCCILFVWLHGSLRPALSDGNPGAAFLVLGLGLTVLQVLAEEALFRGWLLPALAERVAAWAAVLLSSAAFAAFHLVGGAAQPWSFVNLALGGIWFALLALRSGGILAPFAAHYAWNVTEDLGFGLVPNPGRGEFGALNDRDIVGPVLWGGSDEGLNASIAMTVVLVALILPLLPVGRSRAASNAA